MPSQEPNTSVFDRLTKLVVPAVSAAATIASVIRNQRTVAVLLGAVAVGSLLVSYMPTIFAAFARRRMSRRERAAIVECMSELQQYVRRFDQFVNTRTTDTIQWILQSTLCNNNMTQYEGLHLVPAALFAEMWDHLSNRIGDHTMTLAAFRASLMEFNFLVASYCQYLACPAYERVPTKLPPDLRKLYNSSVQDQLIQARERLIPFLDDYSNFVKELDHKLGQPLNIGYYFQRPKPLPLFIEQQAAGQNT